MEAIESHSSSPHKLSELPATAICGNDISSSCLYVAALAILYSGQYAWISLLMVAGVLFLFRKIYGEVVGALPLNGGAYNALLNTTSKLMASLAACLTLLSYMATAVISASEAMHYVHNLWHGLPVMIATGALLFLFMLLTIWGIGESSKVAVFIFITHLVTLTLLVLTCVLFLFNHGLDIFWANNNAPVKGSIMMALFFGFSAAMLGISGFESSANFVEEQDAGVFPKTLRNMWVVVSVFNPLTAFFALALVPLAIVPEHQEALLAYMGQLAGGDWLSWLISIDAAMVLSGAVLTSYVGVNGLIHRMTLDRCLPQFLLKINSRGTTHRIMLSFFLLCVSILFITQGDLEALAGVYTISFLSVMVLFGVGNILLKIRRSRLPRPEKASFFALFLAISAVIIALVGNAVLNPPYLIVFIEYFIPTVIIVFITLFRSAILKVFLGILHYVADRVENVISKGNNLVESMLEEIHSQQFVFFTRGDNIASLNQVMLYVRQNENTRKIKIVTVKDEHTIVPEHLEEEVKVLDRAYPEIDIEFLIIEGHFTPDLVAKLSEEWSIPRNFMFIGSPGDHFPFRIAELGGVRLII